jgi:hypothetical protein
MGVVRPTQAPLPACGDYQDTGLVVAGVGAGMRAYAGLALLVPGVGLPAAATVGAAGSIISFGGALIAGAGHFHIGCNP